MSSEHPGELDLLADVLPEGYLASLLGALNERELLAVQLRYPGNGKPISYKDLGKELGISTERARQVFVTAMRKLSAAAAVRSVRDSLESAAASSIYSRLSIRPGDLSRVDIRNLDMPARFSNYLCRGGIKTLGHLLSADYKRLSEIRGFSRKSIEEALRYVAALKGEISQD